MKVLLINGSSHKEGNTFHALSMAAKTLEAQGIEAEIMQLGNKPVRGCIACGVCKQKGNNRCTFNDDVCNSLLEKAEGADGVSLINTLLGMKIDLKTKKPLLANKTGGLSGPAVKPVAVRMVYQVYEAVKIPIVGIGGIASADDVLEFMLAGAAAVEVGAANLIDPYACKKIIEDLPKAMKKYGINNLSEIIGGAHNG